MDRAYALLTVKAFDAERRTITGIASTPEADRMGDVVEPLGITFKNPLPLLLHHDTHKPVGSVTFAAPTADGLAFEATLPAIAEPGALRDRIDEAWQSIKAGLLAGVSVGFRALEHAKHTTGGLRFLKTEILELSLVTIPANAGATIHTIKSLDLAAPGRHPSRDRDPQPIVRLTKVAPAMTITEQIAALEAKRAAHVARLNAIQTKCAEENRSKDETEREDFATLHADVATIDGELVDARAMEKLNMTKAQPVAPVTPVTKATPVITVQPVVPKGTAFVRAACAMLVCKGNTYEAAEYAKRWTDSTPEVSLYLKAAVAAGNTTDATWAGPLVNQNISNDFIELLRPATILGKIPGLRNVPFNTKVPAQSAGGTYGWVGESKPKPVTKLAFVSASLGISKAAGIIVLTEELVRLSNPSAEALVRADMIAGIAQFLDTQFIDPAVAAVAGVNPASVTNGAPTAAATTSPLADILGLIQHFATNNIAVDGVTFIMSAANALSLSFRTNLDGSPMFPGIGINGGSYRGLTFITSQAAGANVIALQPALVLYADDGQVTIDMSREASLQMDSAPMSPADATTVYVSLWQNNAVGLRAERFINWQKANANAVKYLTATAWPSPTGTTTGTTRSLEEPSHDEPKRK
jgi:HK97 family phage major capsid protein/HK97 family phage prohead protease